MTEREGPEDHTIEIEAPPEGSGAKDRTAPVDGGMLRGGEIDGHALYDQLSAREKAKFARRWQETDPNWIAAKKAARRERMRLFITIVVLTAIVAEAGAALYLAEIKKSVSWDTVKDWLTIAMAPLIGAATVASTFWFPSREAD